MERSKKKQKLGEWQAYLLHCECVRRNSEFRKGYEEWKRQAANESSGEPYLGMLRYMLAAQWGLWWEEPLPNPDELPPLSYISESLPPDAFMLPQEYRVDSAAEKGMRALMLYRPEQPADLSKFAGLLVLNYYPENHPDLVSRGIINLRLSKKSTMKSFENYLDSWLKERKGAKLKQQEPSQRVRLEERIKQLQVYDLRKSQVPFLQIAATLFHGEIGELEKKAKDHFRMAKQLIDNPPLLPANNYVRKTSKKSQPHIP